jgi:hypothetical protein
MPNGLSDVGKERAQWIRTVRVRDTDSITPPNSTPSPRPETLHLPGQIHSISQARYRYSS